MLNSIKKDSEQRMQKAVKVLQDELAKLRTGRAHPSLIEHLAIEYYGSSVPLQQVASVTIGDPRTLLVTPWEKNLVPVIEKAILTAGLGLNPVTAGNVIRVPLPPLTEERRKEIIKVVRAEGEKGKVVVRNIRRDALQEMKELLKNKAITEDEERKAHDDIQKITDKFIKQIDEILAAKEQDLLAV